MKTAHNQEIKEYISLELLLETILNYGDQESVKKLLELMGIDKASEIFNIQISNESTCFGRKGKVERLR